MLLTQVHSHCCATSRCISAFSFIIRPGTVFSLRTDAFEQRALSILKWPSVEQQSFGPMQVHNETRRQSSYFGLPSPKSACNHIQQLITAFVSPTIQSSQMPVAAAVCLAEESEREVAVEKVRSGFTEAKQVTVLWLI